MIKDVFEAEFLNPALNEKPEEVVATAVLPSAGIPLKSLMTNLLPGGM
jgi:hypothetical protein